MRTTATWSGQAALPGRQTSATTRVLKDGNPRTKTSGWIRGPSSEQRIGLQDSEPPIVGSLPMVNTDKSHPTIPLTTTTKVPVKWLALDRRNPRLIPGDDEQDEVSIIAQLYRSETWASCSSLLRPMAILDIEPLVVLSEDGHLTVLEGNRRLAAIRLFEKPDLADLIQTQAQLQHHRSFFPSKIPRHYR